jgi:hypothetical protein
VVGQGGLTNARKQGSQPAVGGQSGLASQNQFLPDVAGGRAQFVVKEAQPTERDGPRPGLVTERDHLEPVAAQREAPVPHARVDLAEVGFDVPEDRWIPRHVAFTSRPNSMDRPCSSADLLPFRSCRMAFLITALKKSPVGIDMNPATIPFDYLPLFW